MFVRSSLKVLSRSSLPRSSLGHRSVYTKRDNIDVWMEDFSTYVKRKKLLIKAAMVQRKKLEFQLPVLVARPKVAFPYSLSDLAGHGSFVFLALSYLESDFLNLRMFAVSGITLSIIFQYYREKPLWIPIRWNTLFLLINAVMIGLLIKEDIAANNINQEEKALYHEVFERKGMSRVDFLHLISRAKRLDVNPGDKLVDETKTNSRVYLVQKGRISVRKAGSEVGLIHENQFVGAMSFLTWDGEQEEQLTVKREQQHNSSFFFASTETQDALDKNKREKEMQLKEKALSPPNSSLSTPAASASSSILPSSGSLLDVTSWYETLHYLQPTYWWQYMGGAEAPPPSRSLSPPSNPQPSLPSTEDEKDGHHGHADAVALSDCIVYSWKFKDLREMKKTSPSLGIVLERCISDDLNKKMFSTWEQESKERYRQLLLGAVSREGVVTEEVKGLLGRFREKQGIGEGEHEVMLREVGWSREEYSTGFKGVGSVELLRQYEELLRREMASGLSEGSRERLRRYRQANKLSSAVHLHVLKTLGWTLDDYEVGKKEGEQRGAESRVEGVAGTGGWRWFGMRANATSSGASSQSSNSIQAVTHISNSESESEKHVHRFISHSHYESEAA